MRHLTNPSARLLLALTVLPTALLVPTIAAADSSAPSTTAQIEHAEQLSAHTVTKAQVEHAERASATTTATRTTTTRRGRSSRPSSPRWVPSRWSSARARCGG